MEVYAHPDLQLSGTTLRDTVLGIDYAVTPDAAWLFTQLRKQPNITHLTNTIAHKKGLSRADSMHALYALLGILDSFGGIRVKGTRLSRWFFNMRRHSLWTRRYPDSLSGFMRSMGRAYGLLLCVLSTPLPVVSFLTNAKMPLLWLAIPSLLFISCIAHELGHVVAVRFYRVPYILLARPVSAAIMYRRPAAYQARIIALLGPMVAALWCGGWAVTLGLHIAGYLFLVVGAIHVASLAPFFADGKTIWRDI